MFFLLEDDEKLSVFLFLANFSSQSQMSLIVQMDGLSVTAGLPISDTHTKNQFASEPEGLRYFRDYRWKALGEENPDLTSPFRQYFESYIE